MRGQLDIAGAFDRHHLRVYRFLLGWCGDPADAEDLTQDVYVRALSSRSSYVDRGREVAWIFRIARNLVIDRQRRLGRRGGDEVEVDDRLGTPAPQLLRLGLGEALAALPADDRQLFLMSQLGGLRYRELAAVFEVTEAAVRSRIFRARMALRDALGPTRRTAADAWRGGDQ